MPLETFHASDALSMGVELELQLVGDHDRDLASGAADLLELALRRAFPGDIKPEMTDSMIEVATGIHAGHDSLLTQLRTMRDALIDAAGRRTCRCAAAAPIRSRTGMNGASTPRPASSNCPVCTAIWRSNSRCSASMCISACRMRTARCACCMH